MADDAIEERVPDPPTPRRKRVKSRAASLREEQKNMDVDDVETEARALLVESDARTLVDPAPKDVTEDRVERRRSEEATPPPE